MQNVRNIARTTQAWNIVIEDDAYDQLIAEAEALPKRRRQLWKSFLLDASGTKSRLAYRDGKLLNYSLKTHEFVEAVPRRSIPGHAVPYSRIGQEALDGANITAILEDEMINNYTGNHYRNNHVKIPKSSDGRLRG